MPKSTRTVYRVERRGRGVYSELGITGIHGTGGHDKHIHPSPWDDTDLGFSDFWSDLHQNCINGPWVFGFASLAQYQNWFYTQEMKESVTLEGFKINSYKVPSEFVRQSNKQCIFKLSKALKSGAYLPNAI